MKKLFVGVTIFGSFLFLGGYFFGLLIADPNAVDLFWLIATQIGGTILSAIGTFGLLVCLLVQSRSR